eukprot:2535976-Pyramimonas_sp.AAC.1
MEDRRTLGTDIEGGPRQLREPSDTSYAIALILEANIRATVGIGINSFCARELRSTVAVVAVIENGRSVLKRT